MNSPGPGILYGSVDAGVQWTRLSVAPGLGLISATSSTGQLLWTFGDRGALWESGDGGRRWRVANLVTMGPGGGLVTVGPTDAWYPVPGQGLYRTRNGTTWTRLH